MNESRYELIKEIAERLKEEKEEHKDDNEELRFGDE